jgi:hypothetical protein
MAEGPGIKESIKKDFSHQHGLSGEFDVSSALEILILMPDPMHLC